MKMSKLKKMVEHTLKIVNNRTRSSVSGFGLDGSP
jgi:hypothetical protein